MTRVFVIGVMVATISLPIVACKKKEEAKQAPAAVEQPSAAPGAPAAPAEPAPAPDKPET